MSRRALFSLLLLSLTGCRTVATTGVHRSPALGDRPLPAPWLLWEVASCLPSGESTGKLAALPELDALLQTELGTTPHPLDPRRAELLCAALAPDATFLDDALAGPRWSVPALGPVVPDGATGAVRTVWIPLRRSHSACRTRDPFFRETDPALPSPGLTPECGDDQRQDVGLFAFDPAGTLLWKGTATSPDGAPGTLATLFRGLAREGIDGRTP